MGNVYESSHLLTCFMLSFIMANQWPERDQLNCGKPESTVIVNDYMESDIESVPEAWIVRISPLPNGFLILLFRSFSVVFGRSTGGEII